MLNKLNNWLERVDPYYTQRIILRKSLYIATWMTIVNFIAKPDVFTAFAFPVFLLTAFYESPSFTTYGQKNKVLVLSFTLAGIGCVLFYLLYPYKFHLLVAVLAFYFVAYWLSHLFFPQFKPCILQTILVAALNITVLPSASLQLSIDMFFCVMLGLLTTYIALNLHPNLYHHVWYRAIKLYIKTVENEISNAIYKTDAKNFGRGIPHINTIRNFMHLLPKQYLFNRMRLTIQMRNISFVLTHIYYHDKNITFWQNFQQQLHNLHTSMEQLQPCAVIELSNSAEKNEAFAEQNLQSAMINWNKLCLTH